MLDSGMAVFLDDILVYSGMVKEHFTLLAHLCQNMFYCKLKKCSFLPKSTIFFGFKVTPKGRHISDLKVWSFHKWPVPTTEKINTVLLSINTVFQ